MADSVSNVLQSKLESLKWEALDEIRDLMSMRDDLKLDLVEAGCALAISDDGENPNTLQLLAYNRQEQEVYAHVDIEFTQQVWDEDDLLELLSADHLITLLDHVERLCLRGGLAE